MVDVTEGFPEQLPDAEQHTDLDSLTDIADANKLLATEHNPLMGALRALSRGTRLYALVAAVGPATATINGVAFRFTGIDPTTGLGRASVDLGSELNRYWAAAVEKIEQDGDLDGTASNTGLLGVHEGILSGPSGTFATGALLGLASGGGLTAYVSGNLPPIGIGLNATTVYIDLTGRVRVDGLTIKFNAQGKLQTVDTGGNESRAFTIESPSDEEDFTLFKTRATMGVTMQGIELVLVGLSAPQVQFNIFFGPDRSLTGTFLASLGFTATNITGGTLFSTFSNAAIPSANWVWLETTVKSGVVNSMSGVTTYTGKI